MAGLTNPNYLTLSEVAQMCHNQEIVPMVDEIGKSTRLFSAMRWRQASDAMRDVTGKVTKYPTTKWVGLDLGAPASKGAWTQVPEGLAQLESWSEINEKTYNVSPHKDRVRWENDQLHIRQMGMDAETGLIYGNPFVDPAQPLGFMARMNKKTDHHRMSGGVKYDYCCLDAGGSTANKQSSILMVAGGPNCPVLLYPRYQTDNGFMYRHFGFENAKDEAGGNIRVAKSQFQITFGLSIADARTVIRIANIETTANGGFDDVRDLIYEAYAAIPQIYRSSVQIFTTADVILGLRKKYANLVNPVTYDAKSAMANNAYGDIFFDGKLIQECEQMLDTEAVVA